MNLTHSVPANERDALEHLVSQGLTNYFEFRYKTFKNSILSYVKSMKVGPYTYRYAGSTQPSLYASIYACMILGLLGELDSLPEQEKLEWKNYFDQFQSCEDGLFYPDELCCDEYINDGEWGDGWGKRHLAGHIIIAYQRLGYMPKYRFSCYDFLFDDENFQKWTKQFEFKDKAWSESNYIMNTFVLLQYNRDYWKDKNAGETVEKIKAWLRKKQNPQNAMWYAAELSTRDDMNSAIRAAYHIFPLFEYDNESMYSTPNIIDIILKTQNKWGGFTNERVIAGACEDIDAVDPLVRAASVYPNYRKNDVNLALKKSMVWILSNYNSDGGATFYIENEHHYGNNAMTTSQYNESNMFSTWFRTLCLAYICDFLGIENDFSITKNPGYEIPIKR